MYRFKLCIFHHNLRKKPLILILLICSVILWFYYNVLQTSFQKPGACYYLKEDDEILSTEDVKFAPRQNSIFFHETSCRRGLTPRQACVIESAARTNPEREIYVLFSAPNSKLSLKDSCLEKLLLIQNIRIVRVHLFNYAKNTSLEKFVVSRPFVESEWWVEHTSDVLRYLTLYKWGGVYLDTDMFLVKSLSLLGENWVAMEDETMANGAAIAIAKDEVGRKLINSIINELIETYSPGLFLHNGPGVLTRILLNLCQTNNRTQWNSKTCKGIAVHPQEYFYPVHYTYCNEYFLPGQLQDDIRYAYSHHLWNKLTFELVIQCDSPLAQMAKEFCPTIYQNYTYEFGGNC